MASYTYTGYQTLGYFWYVDLATQQMLIASPGGSYSMRAVEAGLPIPPNDGNWGAGEGSASPNPMTVSAGSVDDGTQERTTPTEDGE